MYDSNTSNIVFHPFINPARCVQTRNYWGFCRWLLIDRTRCVQTWSHFYSLYLAKGFWRVISWSWYSTILVCESELRQRDLKATWTPKFQPQQWKHIRVVHQQKLDPRLLLCCLQLNWTAGLQYLRKTVWSGDSWLPWYKGWILKFVFPFHRSCWRPRKQFIVYAASVVRVDGSVVFHIVPVTYSLWSH
jgi:hypothetical protein